jgi:hypothetical protein
MIALPAQPRTPFGYVIACHGAVIRAQLSGVATLVSVTGGRTTQWDDVVIAHLRRFTKLDRPLILDVSGADGAQRGLLRNLVSTVETGCDAGGNQLVLVAEPMQRRALDIRDRTLITSSVGEALQRVAGLVRTGRNRAMIAPHTA